MKRIFLDTNVLIDFLANREPFAESAALLFEFAAQNKVQIYISAISFNNIYYILKQSLSHLQAIKHIAQLEKWTSTVAVDRAVIAASLSSEFRDFEDAIQYHCALTVPKLDAVVTRNAKDFKLSSISVLTPVEACAVLAL